MAFAHRVRETLSPLRPVYRGAMGCIKTVHRFMARRELTGRGLVVRELTQAEHARVCSAFPRAGEAPSAADIVRQAAGQVGIVAAWMDDKPLGLGFINWSGPRSAQLARRWPGTPEIYRLRVLAPYRSLGIGTLQIQHLEEAAAAKGHARIGLGVHAGNGRAHALYVRLGYEPDPEPFVDEYTVTLADGSASLVRQTSIFLVKAIGPAPRPGPPDLREGTNP
jgi:GNAT superfamily N-acetyltransferase